VCDGRQGLPRFEVDGIESRVVVCTECGLGRMEPLPTPEQIRAFYPDEYYGEPGTKFQSTVEWVVRWVGRRHIDALTRGLRPRARVLDVGCGRGVILGRLADRGFEVHGQEISAEAARGVDPRARITIGTHLRDAKYPARYFDEVVLWHVLEHLHDPRGTVEEIERILGPGGRLAVAVPNFSSLQARATGAGWFHLDLPRHIYHFPLSALKRLLVRAGFRVTEEHHFSLRQNPFGWIQSWLNASDALPRNGLYTLLHQRGSGAPPPFDTRTRGVLRISLPLLAPFALAATGFETLLRSGASVYVVAERAQPA
jgi:SAM-dependent methyltransferase